jgi:hypothetical protein
VRPIGTEANEIALTQLVALGLYQELDPAMQDVSDFLARMADHVPVVTPSRLKRQQVRLNRVIASAAEQLVQHTAPPAHTRNRCSTAPDDLDAIRAGRGTRLSKQLGDVKTKVLSDQLKPLQRNAAMPVLQR